MATLEQIRDRLGEVLSHHEAELRLCETLLQQIEEHARARERGVWTYGRISRWLGLAPSDALLQRSLAILSTSQHLKALELGYIYFDPTAPDEPGVTLSAAEIATLLRSGDYFDPETGDRVAEAGMHVLPYFAPAPDLLSAPHAG